MFPQYSFPRGNRIEWHNKCAHSQPINRRRRDQAQFLHPSERELQGSRYRRGCQGQDMYVGSKLLQAFLMFDAKMLLFIDDHQSQIFELEPISQAAHACR